MQPAEGLSVPRGAVYLEVNEETVRRNIRSKRLPAVRHGTQWLISRDDLLVFATSDDRKSGHVRQMIQ